MNGRGELGEPRHVELISGGRSNPTYRLDMGRGALVLRAQRLLDVNPLS